MESATEEMNPDSMVEVSVHCAQNAGKEPNSRWGRLKFDDEGNALVKLPVKDVGKLNDMGWLSEEDKEKYLGMEPASAPMEAEAAALMSENDSLRAANTKLASKVAELEAAGETMSKKFDDAWSKEQERFSSLMKAKDEECDGLKRALDGAQKSLAEANAKLEAAAKEDKKSDKSEGKKK